MYNSLDRIPNKGTIQYTLEYYKEMSSSLDEMIHRNYINSDISDKL